ncbi:radical SAM protein (plasmid) [Macrococcoides bohemicum]|uniref:radical SAM protein n=1 Tax=Macrococcoides bohemicum TaxID=1903056 RepID=UPI001C5F6CCB|nr:radical SAM protein [Macrococcus bohemicus]QYA46052.1 radical SAM protein [Macrococcus bohemicus]
MNPKILDYDLYELASINKTLLSVTIELTTKCNWRCKHCYIPEYVNPGLTYDEYDSLFKQLRDLGTFELIFTGGEIFMRSDALEIIENARKHFFDVKLFTNVSLLNESKIKKLAELKISQVSCTVFSMKEDIHDNISKNKGSLKKTLNNLFLLKKYNIDVEVKQILLNINENCLDEVANYCEHMGFKHLATTNIFYQLDGDITPAKYRVDKDYLNKNIVKIDKIRGFRCFQLSDNTYACNATRFSCTIEANGNFLACNNLNIPIDNIKNNNIKNIWEKSKTLKDIQDKKSSELSGCNDCEISTLCNRCSGIALMESNDLWGCVGSERDIALSRYKNIDSYKDLKTITNRC